MEQGKIANATDWGVGQIDAAAPTPVTFTDRTFQSDWSEAVVGVDVQFERYAGYPGEARIVRLV